MKDLMLAHDDTAVGARLAGLLRAAGCRVSEVNSFRALRTELQTVSVHGILVTDVFDTWPADQLIRVLRHPRLGALTVPIGVLCADAERLARASGLAAYDGVRVAQGGFDAREMLALVETNSRDTVLVVDDKPSIAADMTEALGKMYSVRHSPSVDDALDTLRNMEPALIVLDMMMP